MSVTTGPKGFASTVRSVVIADDDKQELFLLKDVIFEADASIKVTVVKNGESLLSLLSFYLPDLLFLDLDMPCKNGLECICEIRRNYFTSQLPVVMYSATSRPHNIETCYEMGAHLYLIKPKTTLQLKEAVKKILLLDWSKAEQIRDGHLKENRYIPFGFDARSANESIH